MSRLKRWKFSGSQAEGLDTVQLELFEESLEADIYEVEAKLKLLSRFRDPL